MRKQLLRRARVQLHARSHGARMCALQLVSLFGGDLAVVDAAGAGDRPVAAHFPQHEKGQPEADEEDERDDDADGNFGARR